MREPLNHLLVAGFKERKDFKSTLSVRKASPPQRERVPHGQRLLGQLAALSGDAELIAQRRAALNLPAGSGMTIALEISPPGSIDYSKQLEWRRDGIEVLSAIDAGGTEIVSLFVPEGKLSAFEKRVQEYIEQDTKPRTPGTLAKPKNARLVNAIASFKRAAFDELWTDSETPPPQKTVASWVQIWLRFSGAGPKAIRDKFAGLATQFGIEVEPGYVCFPGRVVVAAQATRASLEEALELLDMVAEFRGVSPTAEYFLSDLRPYEQAQWIQDLQNRTAYSHQDGGPYITLLDTGVNQGHPLLNSLLNPEDMHAIDGQWGNTDHDGHGTQMAGLTTHGNLTVPLASQNPQEIPHRLESVKILPPHGQNPPHIYGWITSEAASKVESINAGRRRTFAMMTTSSGKTGGMPSEWSSTIDSMAFGLDGHNNYATGTALLDQDENPLRRRLFVLSAGNVPWQYWGNYPTENDTFTVENPGQAWNAITVGACTDLNEIDQAKWPSLGAIAQPGQLSPASSTSLLWRSTWPFKPDVVAEGGNASMDPTKVPSVTVGPESLRLLTTSHDVVQNPLVETGDTSAAAAEIAKICGHLQARYPEYWPETVRALVIHGARYSPSVRAQLPLVPLKKHKEMLLRRYGYGQANMATSLNSLDNKPTLILQEEITPYVKVGGAIKLSELNLHELPWPTDQLLALGGESVEMRITLSYFIEPNPSQRGWQSKFRYQSHGLRFAVKGATENEERFGQRINKLDREELDDEEQESMPDPDREHWFFGAQLRSRGSIHSDVWIGNAAQLAAKSHIAVFPVGGWWKDWSDSERHSLSVRYGLVVTLEPLADIDIDLYTPIATQIGIPVAAVIGTAPE